MDPRIERAVAHIRTNLAAPLSLDSVAASVQLSPSRFAHLFRKHVGTSPAQFIRAVRMARARLLLERTSLAASAVMRLVGCHDPSHFSRDFRRAHGMSPRAWRLAYGLGAPAVRQAAGAAPDRVDGQGTGTARLPGKPATPPDSSE
jgi:AraC family transcriptional regulator of arabinose operon